jgi:hypothetical protein
VKETKYYNCRGITDNWFLQKSTGQRSFVSDLVEALDEEVTNSIKSEAGQGSEGGDLDGLDGEEGDEQNSQAFSSLLGLASLGMTLLAL